MFQLFLLKENQQSKQYQTTAGYLFFPTHGHLQLSCHIWLRVDGFLFIYLRGQPGFDPPFSLRCFTPMLVEHFAKEKINK